MPHMFKVRQGIISARFQRRWICQYALVRKKNGQRNGGAMEAVMEHTGGDTCCGEQLERRNACTCGGVTVTLLALLGGARWQCRSVTVRTSRWRRCGPCTCGLVNLWCACRIPHRHVVTFGGLSTHVSMSEKVVKEVELPRRCTCVSHLQDSFLPSSHFRAS